MTKYIAVMLLLALFVTGCKKPTNTSGLPSVEPSLVTEDSFLVIQGRAFRAGEVAAASYLVAHKPTPEQASIVKKAIKTISAGLKGYKSGSFEPLGEVVKKKIAEEFAKDHKEETILACALVNTLVEELDALFKRHPDWHAQGEKIADIVIAFCDGANVSLTAAGVKQKAAGTASQPAASYRAVTLNGRSVVVIKRGQPPPINVPYSYEEDLDMRLFSDTGSKNLGH